MSDSEHIANIITVLERTLGDLGHDEFSDLKPDANRDEFHSAFRWGEAGGIAASTGTLGIKALSLSDDISDAWEESDVEFLRLIIEKLKQRRQTRAKGNPSPPSVSALPALVEVLGEGVMACFFNDRQRFALMSGYAAGLLFTIPRPYPPLTGRQMVDAALQYHRGTFNGGEVPSAVIEDYVSGAMEHKLHHVIGTRGREVVSIREAVIAGYESNSAGIVEYLRALMAHCCGHEGIYADSTGTYSPEEINALQWARNFGLRKSRAIDPCAGVPDPTRTYTMARKHARWLQNWDQASGPPNPIDMSYWVVPGRLLAGEYPRNPDTASSREKLARLTSAGVSVFVDLTEDCENLKPYAYLLNGQIHQRFPIKDQNVPHDDQLTKSALDAIDRHLGAGRTVYVHCMGGVGRTGTVIGCWLSRHYEPGQAALNRLKDLWQKNPKRHVRPRTPENDLQDNYVRTWGGKDTPVAARYEGCMVGLAVGDAVGTTLEFKSPGTFEPVTDMTGGGPFNLKPGQWTDDTAMALCLADSLLARTGFSAGDQMNRYIRWYRDGYLSSTGTCFDIGNTTRDALLRYERTQFPLAGSTDPETAGNGSLMRLAPVAMYYARRPAEAIKLCGESSRTTHGARACLDACRYFGGLIVGALHGLAKEELLSERFCPTPGLWEWAPLCSDIDVVAAGSFKRRQPPEIIGSGYVVKSLEAALWAFYNSDTFEEGCLMAANLGNDADTTAAIYGQLAGAFYGIDGIPSSWREQLINQRLISSYASSLHAQSRQLDI